MQRPPLGISKTKYYFLLWRRYFEQGYSITGYVKFLIAIFGISSLNVWATMALGAGYGIASFVIGYYWYKNGFLEADTEIGNQFNPFVKEMRRFAIPITANMPVYACVGGVGGCSYCSVHRNKDIWKDACCRCKPEPSCIVGELSTIANAER